MRTLSTTSRPELGDDMEEIVDDAGVWTMRLNLQIHGRVHVHGDGFDVLTVLAQPLEEGPDRRAGAAFADPEHLLALSIHDDRGVAMAFEQGKLIHHQEAHAAEIRLRQCSREAGLINGLQGMPVQLS
jgi:hypothetical protein